MFANDRDLRICRAPEMWETKSPGPPALGALGALPSMKPEDSARGPDPFK